MSTTTTPFGAAEAQAARTLIGGTTLGDTRNELLKQILVATANKAGGSSSVAFADITGAPTDNAALAAALAGAGGSSLAFPKTLYVSVSLGNDGTAVAGDPSKPFLTGQAAFNAWLLLGSAGHIHVMDGAVSGITLAADMMHDLHITGAGPWCKMTDVYADGTWGTDGGDDEHGGPGGAGYEIRITSDLTVNLGSISSVGGQGGNGGFNASNETDGGEGGRGGRVRLFNVLCDSFSNNGGGGGNPSEFGNPGAGGKPGDTALINVHVRTGGISSQEASGALTPDVTANLIRCIADSGAITVTAQLGEVAFCSASSYSVSGGVLEHSNHTMAYAPAWP